MPIQKDRHEKLQPKVEAWAPKTFQSSLHLVAYRKAGKKEKEKSTPFQLQQLANVQNVSPQVSNHLIF